MSDIAIKIENLSKEYRLGAIGGMTLKAEVESWWARKRGMEDPNLPIRNLFMP
jgi:lipopolysaccharide transport system ATP-binding protein